MKQFKAHILANQNLKGDFYKLTLHWEGSAPLPGQFLTLRINEHTVPLLRRPFAISGYEQVQKQASIIYIRRGQATGLLSEKCAGESIDCIGPLGHAFPAPTPGKLPLLIAGGTGLGPILFMAQEFVRQEQAHRFIFGARDSALIPACEEFTQVNPVFCTDDGSLGFKGTVVDYLTDLYGSTGASALHTELFCCGPLPMLKACHEFAQPKELTCWVSMEQVMACALGACMGCVIELTSGFARVCSEGPVFDSRSIKWT
jgi:dihydroorotate dehydrogenase electron transfer subunit